jgi:hypothetical protein
LVILEAASKPPTNKDVHMQTERIIFFINNIKIFK